MPNPHPRLRSLTRADLKQCKLPANPNPTEKNLKVHWSRLINIQRHSAPFCIEASPLNDGGGAIVVMPQRIDPKDDRVHRPREDVGGARDEKDLLRIVN